MNPGSPIRNLGPPIHNPGSPIRNPGPLIRNLGPLIHEKAQDLIGVVLAGGTSRRMGADKARLSLRAGDSSADSSPARSQAPKTAPPDRTWLERAVALLAERLDPVWVIGRIALAGGADLPNLKCEVRSHLDLRPGCGPLGGLETALKLAEGRGVLAIPCDLPGLPAHVLDQLLAGRDREALATAFRSRHGRSEPAVLILESHALEPLVQYLDAGGRKVETFLDSLGARWLPVREEDEAGFANLNTPSDREQYEASSGTRQGRVSKGRVSSRAAEREGHAPGT